MRLLKSKSDSRPINALVRLSLDELQDKLNEMKKQDNDDLSKSALVSIVKNSEGSIYTGLQQFPGDEHLLLSKAKLTNMLGSHDDVKKILVSAYENNKSSDYLAISLARNMSNDGYLDASIDLLRTAISKTPTSRPLHLALAKDLISSNKPSLHTEILHHLQRSFSPNDTNYDAQFWFARQHYLLGSRGEAQKVFESLKATPLPPYLRNRVAGEVLEENGIKIVYNGKIVSEHVNFYFIKCSELNDVIYANVTDFESSQLIAEDSIFGSEVTLNLAFSVIGPKAININILSHKSS
jgi:hypothetical protein